MASKHSNSKHYVKLHPKRKGSRASVHLDDYTKAALENVAALLERFHGLHYSRDLLIRRALLNYCKWMQFTVQQGKQAAANEDWKTIRKLNQRLKRERDTLIRVSGREKAELDFYSKPEKDIGDDE